MMDIYGDYPTAQQKESVATLLGCLTKLPPTVFFDKKSFDGFLQRALENLRRKWEGEWNFPLLFPLSSQLVYAEP